MYLYSTPDKLLIPATNCFYISMSINLFSTACSFQFVKFNAFTCSLIGPGVYEHYVRVRSVKDDQKEKMLRHKLKQENTASRGYFETF